MARQASRVAVSRLIHVNANVHDHVLRLLSLSRLPLRLSLRSRLRRQIALASDARRDAASPSSSPSSVAVAVALLRLAAAAAFRSVRGGSRRRHDVASVAR